MTDIVSFEPASEPASTESIDPATLADRPDVEYCEETHAHEERDHCEAGAAGRAIVGVADGDGALLLCVREGGDHAILPNGIVDADDAWTETAREAVETLGVAVDIEDAERVRRVEHVHEDGTHLDTTHHVVFRASTAGGTHDGRDSREEPAIACDDEWTATWVDEPPVALDRENDGAFADIRLFAE
jgi:hypothetical protein